MIATAGTRKACTELAGTLSAARTLARQCVLDGSHPMQPLTPQR